MFTKPNEAGFITDDDTYNIDIMSRRLNNLQFTDNDLIITAISRKLRSSDDVSLTVEKTNKINKLVEKLLINIKKE